MTIKHYLKWLQNIVIQIKSFFTVSAHNKFDFALQNQLFWASVEDWNRIYD